MKCFNYRSERIANHATVLTLIQQAGESEYTAGRDERGYWVKAMLRPETVTRIDWFMNN